MWPHELAPRRREKNQRCGPITGDAITGDVWAGAGITAFFFVLGKFAIAVYLGKAAVGSSFGAAGSFVVLLVWVYWSAQILFFGAKLTHVYALSRGSRSETLSSSEAVKKSQDEKFVSP